MCAALPDLESKANDKPLVECNDACEEARATREAQEKALAAKKAERKAKKKSAKEAKSEVQAGEQDKGSATAGQGVAAKQGRAQRGGLVSVRLATASTEPSAFGPSTLLQSRRRSRRH